jgi:hypothetical protein
LALLALAPSAKAEDRIWTALVLASNVDAPKNPPVELMPIASKVRRVFGYNQVELLGTADKTIDDEVERWLVPSPHFWLCAKAKKAGADAYQMKLSIYQDKRCLVQGEAKLGANSPLLIRGPMHARGQLIIVLKVDRLP